MCGEALKHRLGGAIADFWWAVDIESLELAQGYGMSAVAFAKAECRVLVETAHCRTEVEQSEVTACQ